MFTPSGGFVFQKEPTDLFHTFQPQVPHYMNIASKNPSENGGFVSQKHMFFRILLPLWMWLAEAGSRSRLTSQFMIHAPTIPIPQAHVEQEISLYDTLR